MSDQNLGDALVKQDVITREELNEARRREEASGIPWYRQLLQTGKLNFSLWDDILRHEFHPKSIREEHAALGRTLVAMGAITEYQLKEALSEQRRNGRLLGNILQDRGWVDRSTIAKALSKQHGLEFCELADAPSTRAALDAVPEGMARKNQMIPIRLEGDKLTVLITNPQATHWLGDVGVILGKRIYPILTCAENINQEIIARYRGSKAKVTAPVQRKPQPSEKEKQPMLKPIQKLAETKPAKVQKTGTVTAPEPKADGKPKAEKRRFDQIAKEASGMPVVKLVSTIIEGAANSGATDIHLDPQEPEMRVRYRIDGVLHDVMSIPPDIESAVVSRIKIMSDLDITETRHPQDGHIGVEVGGREYDIRVATLPTFLGERVVLRMLDQSSVLAGIKDLGLEPEDEAKLMGFINQPYGMILVTGPTGSGKTTTLYAALNQKNVMTESIVTLENPVEYQLSGINQVQIDTDIGVTFASTLRAALRQDIDVILVGEIRDPETAHIAIRAAMTGHLVFSTMHTNDAPEAISTLRNMGVPSYLIGSALTAVLAQRLVRKICPECRTGFTPDKGLLKTLNLPLSTKTLYRGRGCEACYHTGSKGRTGIFEVLDVTDKVRKLITEDATREKIVEAASLKTMAERGQLKVKRGLVAPEELLKVVRT